MSDLRTKAVPFPLSRPIAVRMPGAVKYKFFSIMTKNQKKSKKVENQKNIVQIMRKKLFGKFEEEKRRYKRNFKALAFAS